MWHSEVTARAAGRLNGTSNDRHWASSAAAVGGEWRRVDVARGCSWVAMEAGGGMRRLDPDGDAMRGGHSDRLERFLEKWSSPGVRPGRSVGAPGWWHLKRVDTDEYAATQRAVGVALALGAVVVPIVAAALNRGLHGGRMLVTALLAVTLAVLGVMLIRHSSRRRRRRARGRRG